MNYYEILDKLKGALLSIDLVTTVTEGVINEVNLNRADLMPLFHVTCNSCTLDARTITWNFSIIGCDAVDESKQTETDKFVGADNTQDVHNMIQIVFNRLYKSMQSGDLFDEFTQIESTVELEPFVDRFENKLAGWTMTFDVITPNEMSIC